MIRPAERLALVKLGCLFVALLMIVGPFVKLGFDIYRSTESAKNDSIKWSTSPIATNNLGSNSAGILSLREGIEIGHEGTKLNASGRYAVLAGFIVAMFAIGYLIVKIK